MISNYNRSKFVIVFSLALIIGAVLGYVYSRTHQSVEHGETLRENSPDYTFINPILLTDNSKISFPEFEPLKDKIQDEISQLRRDKKINNASVYFRDLNSSKWTGVGEGELYSPSSMLKLTTLLAYLKAAQDNPELLQEKVYYSYENDPGQYYKPIKALPSGNYSKGEILVQMIVNSDNSAMELLNSKMPDNVLKVYKELGLPDPALQVDDFMSPEMFSRVLRTLYNSTYLSRTYSEQALKLLSYTTFKSGLVAGTASTTVAHKFGEHALIDQGGKVLERQLHDCGIVYYPNKPYLLCIMTRGSNFPELEDAISGIAGVVYKSVQSGQ
jgi:hypothetical protein